MRTAIDQAGRVVVPKKIRDRLGLRGGESLEVIERDGVIELHVASLEVDIVDTPQGPVAVPTVPVPPLTDAVVRDTLDQIRR